ncbi:MAG: serine/threonine protein kinase [Wenzhouxiangellaceae bacterium]|nr:MAG: serine/threonine protein kinase [Wenzhouxiangellaceae bacterium]
MPARPGSEGIGDALAPEVEALLMSSLDSPPESRDEYLAQATDDPELRSRVRELLAAHARGERSLRRLAQRIGAGSEPSPTTPERAGPYRLIRELGRGGMSVVYLGQRDDGLFEHQVAVKLLVPRPGNDALLKRFEAERQLLARLGHAHIARLLDGGRTEEGWPYFVMELVDGVPIDQYCDDQRLNIEQRLGLFLQVLDAVQYAHRNLVVHRDLKPSNILVSPAGEVKLLDFGIAKLLDEDGLEARPTELTGLGGRPMTPAWASPEQVLGQAVTTASDVYALGALLYVLLCGRSPYQGPLDEPESLRRAILETPPLPPSRRLGDLGDGHETIAAEVLAERRSTRPARLRQQLQGDLDVICAVALRKTPERRYATVEQLATDIERHRARLPIRARPDTLGYRFGKLVRRHPVGLPSALAMALIVAAAVFVHTERLEAERNRAEIEAARAEAAAESAVRQATRAGLISDYLVGLFRAADPHFASDHATLTAMDLIERGVERTHELADTPDLQANMLVTLGYVYRNLGENTRAVELIQSAVDILAAHPGEFAGEHIDALNALGLALAENGAHHDAAEHYRLALAEVALDDETRRASILNNLAATLNALGDYEGAEAAHREGLAIRLRLEMGDYEEALSRNNLGAALWRQGRIEEALEEFERALELRLNDPDLGPEHPYTTTSMGNVAASLMALGRLEESYAIYTEALRLRRSALGEDHPRIVPLLHMMGRVRWGLDDVDGAERYWTEALAIRQARLPPGHASIGASLNALARVALHRGDLEHAESLLLEALEIKRAAYGDDHPGVADLRANMARLRERQERFDEARDLLAAALTVRLERLGVEHPAVLETKRQFVDLELAAGNRAAALDWSHQALGLMGANNTGEESELLELQQQISELTASLR